MFFYDTENHKFFYTAAVFLRHLYGTPAQCFLEAIFPPSRTPCPAAAKKKHLWKEERESLGCKGPHHPLPFFRFLSVNPCPACFRGDTTNLG